MTAAYVLWRHCERFGMNPHRTALEPWEARRAEAYEVLRWAEEARIAAMGKTL